MKPASGSRMALVFVLACAPAGGSVPVSGGTDEKPLRITVSIYDYAGTRECVLENAAKTITDIFKRAGIEVRCVTRKSAKSPRLPFQLDPKNPSNFALRIIRRPKKTVGLIQWSTGGYAVSGGSYATVIADSIRDVARSTEIPESTILAITAAHELGHLLLPAAYHSEAGIMQEHLTKPDWQMTVQGALSFSKKEAGTMCRHLLARGRNIAALNPK